MTRNISLLTVFFGLLAPHPKSPSPQTASPRPGLLSVAQKRGSSTPGDVDRYLQGLRREMRKRIQFASRRNNDQKLWTDVRRSLINPLQLEWRRGKLKGSKASQAFYVHCDRATMTQNDLDQGRLIVVVGLAPVRPAEFQIIRLVQQTIPASNRIVRNRDHRSSTQDGV